MSERTNKDSKDCRSTTSQEAPAPQAEPLSPYSQPGTWTPSQFKPKNMAEMRARADGPTNTYGNANRKKHNVREYTLGEEIANSITHGLGIALAIAAIPILVITATGDGGGIRLFAALVYAITMVLEYTMSTLYHAIAVEKAKRVFKILDHSCIYLFIAGSYTPFCLVSLADSGGIWLCVFVWVVALAGVACEAFWVFRPRWISAVLYLLLGWCVIWFLRSSPPFPRRASGCSSAAGCAIRWGASSTCSRRSPTCIPSFICGCWLAASCSSWPSHCTCCSSKE